MNGKALFELLLKVPDALILVCLIIGLLRFRSLGPAQRLLTLLIIVTGATEIISQWLWKRQLNNFPVIHVYAILEFSILMLIYHSTFQGLLIRKLLKAAIFVFAVFGAVNALFFQSLQEPNTNVITTSSILLVGLSVWFLFRVLNDMRYDRLEKSAMFWINIGVFTYFSSSFVLFNFGEELVPYSIESTINVWTLHIFFNVLHYIAYCIALWMKPE